MFESSRLRYREFTTDDFENLFSLDGDPEVLRFITEGVAMSALAVQATLDRIVARYKVNPDFAIWAAEQKETGEFIGWFALKPLPDESNIEVGYRLKRKFWGQGFATEGAKLMVERGFEAGLEKLVALTHPGNLASQRVLKKVGFRHVGPGPFFSPNLNREVMAEWFEQYPGPHQLRR